MGTILKTDNIRKIYQRGSEDIYALDNISLEIKKSEYVSFTGPSGSGKTTLINILGCLDNPSSGTLSIGEREIFKNEISLSEKELTIIRRELFGYIFQSFYLILTLNVLENIMLPYTFYKKADVDISTIISSLGLDKRVNHFPKQLSGGEMQRVAIARAFVNKPEIILADEPTGNLDSSRSREIGVILSDLNKKEGITIILVTHNLELAKTADRIIELRDGKIVNS
ncbi:MAG: ABC transporter ATP-binding protein [Candidatus Edwardsbacteria bacterium]